MLIPRKTLVPALLCALYFFFQPVLFAQKISIPVQLKTGRILFDDVPSAGIDPSSSVFRPFSFDGKLYLMLTFRSIPVQSVKDKLHDEGIELLEYIPENTFMASIRKAIPAKIFNQAGITGFQSLKSFFKIDPVLTGEWNSDPNKKFPVRISYQKDITPEIIEKTFRAAGFNATGNNSGFELVMNQEEMNQMALAPYITFIEPVAGDPVPLNDGSRVLLESVRLTSTTPGIGRGLSGRDVVIGLGDDGGIAHHPDFGGRLIPEGEYFNTNHATHVAGIMAGGGILNPLYRGHAANAKIIVNGFNGIISSTPLYYSKYGMVLTNNSYGLGPLNCNNYGNYSYISRSTDEQLKNLPEVMHVFAAGNDGWITCAPNAPGYRTIYAHHQVAKNVLTVTGTARDPDFHFYSVGPTRDGRLKPEITSIGFEVLSTILNAKLNSKYGYNYGSSMAAPQVTGILALLVERYRQLHGNTCVVVVSRNARGSFTPSRSASCQRRYASCTASSASAIEPSMR
ncbi:MAG TPA: S8 family serine peptidase [Flavitalea sp.]|nr:S8 family serine peptidase [Flavitalea sp.]